MKTFNRVLSGTVIVSLCVVASLGFASHVRADMVVFSNDFETDTTGFTAGGSLTAGGLSRFQLPTDGGQLNSPNQSMWLGRLGYNVAKVASINGGPSDEIVNLNLAGLTVGTVYTVAFDLFIGGSWDGAADNYGQDRWRFSVDGTRLVDTMFANGAQGVNFGAYSPQRYSDTFYSSPGTSANDVSRFSGADYSYSANINGNYTGDYAIYSFSHGTGNPVLNFTATSSTAALQFARFGNTTDSSDEYWALDNVQVTTPSVSGTSAPLPASLPASMALLGGLLGASLWRRLSTRRSLAAPPMLSIFPTAFETLEGRRLLSTVTVLNTLDSGPGSLRAEISAAHNGETVVFASSLAGQTIALTSGQLLIKQNITIAGPANRSVTVSGNNASRVFYVAKTVRNAVLSGLTISNGFANGPTNTAIQGGGIANDGTLTVTNSTLSYNVATNNGGGISNDGTLTVNGSSLSNNSCTGYEGGGIANFGTAILSGCTLSGNSGGGSGGGIANSASLTISNSFLTGNSAFAGGGIYGAATISNTTLSENSAYDGGAIYDYNGAVTLTGSTLSGNVASDQGGGIYLTGYGTGYATMTISNSTLSANSAVQGGGIYNSNGTLAISGSTVSGNGNSTTLEGGGVYNFAGSLKVSNSIFSTNSPDNLFGSYTDGGGNTFI